MADIVLGALEAAGVRVMISSDEAGGEAPAVAHSARVLVRSEDRDDAREIIEGAELDG